MNSNDDIVASWVAGWALSREVGPPTPAYGGLKVDVGHPDQKARYVFANASPGVREAALAIREPFVFLKVCAPPDEVQPFLSEGWNINPVSFMMRTSDLQSQPISVPASYTFQARSIQNGHVVNVLTSSGELAASGRVFLVDQVAVFDRIETHPDHRRRGLGRIVMEELGKRAIQSGALEGALVATPDGRALYSAMGWRLHSLYTTAIRD